MRSFAKFPCSVSLGVLSGVGPFDLEHLVFPGKMMLHKILGDENGDFSMQGDNKKCISPQQQKL